MLGAMRAAGGERLQAGQMASLGNRPQYLLPPQRKWIWMARDLDEPLGLGWPGVLRTGGAATAGWQVLGR